MNKPVLAAGEILLDDDGDIMWIDNQSGHFEPKGQSPLEVVKATFERKGWRGIEQVYHDVSPKVKCPSCDAVHASDMFNFTDDLKLKLAKNLGYAVARVQEEDQ